MKKRIDVFISSTSIDLPEHRQAVINALLGIGLVPSSMEHWPVEDNNPVDICRQKIRDAEIYMGIYAHRYGWRPNGPGTPSITEMEYEWATERGIPRYCFIMDDDYPWPMSKMELDAKADLDAFKARVKQQVVGFFTTPDNLKAQVATALAGYAQKQDINLAEPYLRRLHHDAMQSGLLRVLDPHTKDPAFQERQVTVDQVYTALDTQSRVVRSEGGRIQWEVTDRPIREMPHEDETSSLAAMEAASHYLHLVVSGEPGSGKSTFVSFLVLGLTGHLLDPKSDWLDRLREQGWEHAVLLPVYVTLRDFAQDMGPEDIHGTVQSLLGHIERQLGKSGCPEGLTAVKQAVSEGRALLILDGLDEVPAEEREVVRSAVQMFMQAFERCRVVITCRILSYANPAWQIPDTAAVTLAPFDEDKIQHFIRAWYHASAAVGRIEPELAQVRIGDLTAAVKDARLRDMASNPMLLTVMAIVHNHQGRLPRETARLYHACVEILMLKWKPEAARHLREVLDLVDETDLYRILWQIAYEAHEKQADRQGAADIPKSEVMTIAAEYHLDGDYHKAQLFCDYVEERAGLLVGRGGDAKRRVYTFPHRTFQEFLAGCHLADDMNFVERIDTKAHAGANWREVLLLAIGHMYFNKTDRNQPVLAVQSIVATDPAADADWQAVVLAGEMLLLIGVPTLEKHKIGAQVLEQARERLATLVSEGQLEPVERTAAGRVLADLSDPRSGTGALNDIPVMAWCAVPAGRFKMGGDPDARNGPDRGVPEVQADLPYPFWIAKYPVTYAQYGVFVEAGGYRERRYWTETGWQDKGDRTEPYEWNDPHWHIANHPVVGVTWYEAYAYTQWLEDLRQTGKLVLPSDIPIGHVIRLARECEWEKAARVPDGRKFPWGDTWYVTKLNGGEGGIGRTSAVGQFPDGANPTHGACDLSGNVWEWCLTAWRDTYITPEAEDNDPIGGSVRCVRGGSWDVRAFDCRASSRGWGDPGFGYFSRGFRVVVSVSI